jgi:hypothetical protein
VISEPAPEFRLSSLPRGPALACAALVLLFAAEATYFDLHEGTWYDEACSMTSAQGTFSNTLDHAQRMEQQPPLYFLVLNLWLKLHRSIGFARLLSVLPTILGVLLTLRTFVRVSRPPSPAAVPLILAVLLASPMTMYLATEARGYAFQFVLGALIASTMAEIQARGSATRTDVVTILAAGVLLSYIHYVAGLAAGCATIALLAARLIRLRQAAVIAVGGILLGSPLLLTVRGHVQAHAAAGEGWTLEGPLIALERLTWVVLPHAVARGHWQAWIGAVVAAAVGVGLILQRRAGLRPALPRPFLLASGLTVGIFLALGFATGAALVIYERYYAAFLSVILVTSFTLLRASLGWMPALAVLLTLAAGGQYRILALHGPGIRKGDWRRIAAKLDRDLSPSLPVYVFPPPESLSLKVEIADPRRVEAFPYDYDGDSVVRAPDYRIPDQEPVRARIARRAGTGRFWLAYTLNPIRPVEVERPLEPVEAFLARRCVIESDFPFKDSHLLLLRLRE